MAIWQGRATEDYTEAVRVVSQSCRTGLHPWAQTHAWVVMYGNGKGVPEDDAEAVKWYRRAAEQGHALAQSRMGFMYALGEGVPLDDVEAYAWFNISVAQGNKDDEDAKRRLAESMTPERRARAQELSREYWEAYVLPFRN